MSPQRKIYETRSQKTGDFFIGVGLMIGMNVIIGLLLDLLLVGMGAFSGAAGTTTFTIYQLVMFVLSCAPFVVNIGLIIYFGLTRYWIALGMLAVIAFLLLISLCLTAACFVLLGGGMAGWFNNPIPTPIP
ncbi:MAG: hypothetical protein WA821_15580 [Anaerolineales bacterium]